MGWGGFEPDRHAVDAVAEAGGGLGGVFEDVSEVGTAAFAHDFDSAHSVGEVFFVLDGVGVGVEERGPSAVGVEFRAAWEEGCSAGPAVVLALPFEVPIFAGEGSFGAFFSEDVVFELGELFFPLGFGF